MQSRYAKWVAAIFFLLVSGAGLPAAAAGDKQDGDGPARCLHRSPERRALFGDVHIHSAWSMDASTADVRATPDDSYRFASGGELMLPGGRSAQLERPLDFAAVSDHAEFLGEVSLCTNPDSEVYGERACGIYRGEIEIPGGRGSRMGALADREGEPVIVGGLPMFETNLRSASICGPGAARCRDAARTVWQRTVEAADRWNDTSEACSFTALPAYEYTLTPMLSKVHRNVIFASSVVPALPTSSTEAPDPLDLWRALRDDCLDAGTGCDVLAIPHNSNLSNGRMFTVDYRDEPLDEQRRRAALRARIEPLVEIMQVKGDSECRNGFAAVAGGRDELCEFEKFRSPETEDCQGGTGVGALGGVGCISHLDFVRYALIEGLREADRIGVNPYRLGISASTDTHNASPGDTEESSYDGAHGAREASVEERLLLEADIVAPVRANPGGLFGVWAEENSRASIFAAMKRRETFGTSGTRIRPRFFAGWGFAEDFCQQPDRVAQAYGQGVPMGQDLPPAGDDAQAPIFVATALRDPGPDAAPGARLERIQIVKGWVGEGGRLHQAIFDVAGSALPETGVDPQSCQPDGSGADALCGVWKDPDFDPSRRAVYYARVVERPSCRWSARHCAALPDDERPPACTDPSIPATIRERAWTSPIWYTPDT